MLLKTSSPAGKRSAIERLSIYSLLLSAEAQGVDPQAYRLTSAISLNVPTATTSDLDRLTPANWAAEHKAATAATQSRVA